MLVLSRLKGETIMIGDEVEITVVDIRGDKVKLGITAPTRIAVHRKEVYLTVRREQEKEDRATRVAHVTELVDKAEKGLVSPQAVISTIRGGRSSGTNPRPA